jgi:hypothetical protein
MDVQIIYRFPAQKPGREMALSWQWQNEIGGTLALVYVKDSAEIASALSFLILDIPSKRCLEEVTYRSLEMKGLEGLHLAYDASTQTWVIGDLEEANGWYYVVLRSLQRSEHGQLVFSNPLFADPAKDMAPAGPLLAVHAENNICVVLYLKTELDSSGTPSICLERIDLSARPSRSLRKQDTTSSLDVENELTCGESALVFSHDNLSLLLTFTSRGEGLEEHFRGWYKDRDYSWGGTITVYDNQFTEVKWTYNLVRGFSVKEPVLQNDSDFRWLGVNAAASTGPYHLGTGQPTFIVGMAVMNFFGRNGYDHSSEEASQLPGKIDRLVCLDHQGQEVQACTTSIGLRLQMCHVQSLMVGIDIIDGRWRLWNWAPLSGASFQSMMLLDEGIIRAHVLADPDHQQENYFWLIEESREEIKISQCDAHTLTSRNAVELPEVHLLESQKLYGSMDWHTSVEALFFQGTLLLLGLDQTNQLMLYQIKA